jgi:hypothetical protein
VLYISEKHAQKLPDGRIAFAIAQIVCAPAIEQHWKIAIVDRITQRWSEFRTGDAAVSGHPNGFESVIDVPPQMPRHEAWKLAYRRNPYLRSLTDRDLMVQFHRCVGFSALLTHGSWPMPSMDEHLGYVRKFGDAIEEINHRGIDLRQFAPQGLTPEERAQAYAGLPQELVDRLSRKAM